MKLLRIMVCTNPDGSVAWIEPCKVSGNETTMQIPQAIKAGQSVYTTDVEVTDECLR